MRRYCYIPAECALVCLFPRNRLVAVSSIEKFPVRPTKIEKYSSDIPWKRRHASVNFTFDRHGSSQTSSTSISCKEERSAGNLLPWKRSTTSVKAPSISILYKMLTVMEASHKRTRELGIASVTNDLARIMQQLSVYLLSRCLLNLSRCALYHGG